MKKLFKILWTLFLLFCSFLLVIKEINNYSILWDVPRLQWTPAMEWSIGWPFGPLLICFWLILITWGEW